ncbi:MAG: response regulator transcription factor [Acidobacteria bacterium]|nr:response regulator transcription factor [Acidobacteriota bacterium]
MTDILLIDDDTELGELLTEWLADEGFRVTVATDGRQGLAAALTQTHALVVLDVMLPALNGLEVLRAIRRESSIPVIMLTARGEDIDRIIGLEIGADDYLPKPFNPRELVARIRAILRRQAGGPAAAGSADTLRVDDVVLDSTTRSVELAGRPIRLTMVEFELLALFLRHAGQVIRREQISTQILGRELAPFDRSVDVHVSSLRRKLGPGGPERERIRAVRGVGYLYLAAGKSAMLPADQ